MTTKILLLADALGRPLCFLLTGGQVHEMLDGVEGDAVIADKAYDSDAIRAHVKAAGMKAVIPLVVASGETSKMLQCVETAFDAVGLAVERFVVPKASSATELLGCVHVDALNVDSA